MDKKDIKELFEQMAKTQDAPKQKRQTLTLNKPKITGLLGSLKQYGVKDES